jgi:hypothetical protein
VGAPMVNATIELRQRARAACRRNVGDEAATNSPLLAPTGLADGFGLEEALPPKWFHPRCVVPRLPGKAPGIRQISVYS